MIGHTGQIPGFASGVGYHPRLDITVVALGNDDSFDARIVGRRLAAIALGKPYPDVVAVAPSDEELRSVEGSYRIDEHTDSPEIDSRRDWPMSPVHAIHRRPAHSGALFSRVASHLSGHAAVGDGMY